MQDATLLFESEFKSGVAGTGVKHSTLCSDCHRQELYSTLDASSHFLSGHQMGPLKSQTAVRVFFHLSLVVKRTQGRFRRISCNTGIAKVAGDLPLQGASKIPYCTGYGL